MRYNQQECNICTNEICNAIDMNGKAIRIPKENPGLIKKKMINIISNLVD